MMLEFRTQGHQELERRSAAECYFNVIDFAPAFICRDRGEDLSRAGANLEGDTLSFNWLVQCLWKYPWSLE